MCSRAFPAVFLAVVISLFAAGCNGHGDAGHDQSYTTNGWSMDHNHDRYTPFGQVTAQGTTVFERTSGSQTLQARVCIIGVVTRNSDGQTVGDPAQYCTGFESIPTSGLALAAPVQIAHNSSTHTLNAYESWTDMRFYSGATLVNAFTCQYHDPDGSNPNFCPGRDANGDL